MVPLMSTFDKGKSRPTEGRLYFSLRSGSQGGCGSRKVNDVFAYGSATGENMALLTVVTSLQRQ